MNKLENALNVIEAILDGYKAGLTITERKGEKIYFSLYVQNPYYNPEIQGESPALVLDFEDLRRLLENVVIVAEEK